MGKLPKRFDNKEGNEDSRIQIKLNKSEKKDWEKSLKNKKKKKTSIRVRMDSEKKKSWIDFVEKSKEFKTISQLIRTTVNDLIFSYNSKR